MTSNAHKKRRNRDIRPAPGKSGPQRPSAKGGTPKGCAPSFLAQKMNQEGICELDAEQQRDQYVLPDAEKETGGEA